MVINMVKGNTLGLMEDFSTVNTLMINVMVLEPINGQMVESMRVIGKMGDNMDMELLKNRMKRKKKGIGKKENV